MITTTQDAHGHVRSYFGMGAGPETALRHLADAGKEIDLGFMCDEWHIMNELDLYAASDNEPITLYVMRGLAPRTETEEQTRIVPRSFLPDKKTSVSVDVRKPREWIGTITYTPRDGSVTLTGEAYGPKGLEQLDEERGRMVLVDENDSLVLMSKLLADTMRRSEDDVRTVLHRANSAVHYEQLREETE